MVKHSKQNFSLVMSTNAEGNSSFDSRLGRGKGALGWLHPINTVSPSQYIKVYNNSFQRTRQLSNVRKVDYETDMNNCNA